MSRTENAKRNIVWGVIKQVILVFLPFLTRTVLIHTLGINYAGLNGLFTSILQVLNLSELGISSAIIYSMYEPIANGDNEKVCALLNFYKRCYRIIGFIVVILGTCVVPFLPVLIKSDTPENINIYVLYLLNLFSVFMSYELYAYKMSLLNAMQKSNIVSLVEIISTLLKFVIQTIILLAFHNYYIYLIVAIIFGMSNNIIIAIVSTHMYPEFSCTGEIDDQDLRRIKKNVGGMIFERLGNVILFSVDTIVISAFLGLVDLGIYQNYYCIITAAVGFFGVIQTALTSSVGNALVLKSRKENYDDFRKFNLLYVLLAGWCGIIILNMIQPFMNIWLGTNYMLPDYFALFFALYFFIFKWCDMCYVYQTAAGLWWETKYVPIIAALVNFVFNIILVQTIGLVGILISTIISILFVYNTLMPYILFKKYFSNISLFFNWLTKQAIYLLSISVIAVITYKLCSFFDSIVVFDLIIRLSICFAVPFVLVFAILGRNEEFKDGVRFLRRILLKRGS